jgi:hypothetical protein
MSIREFYRSHLRDTPLGGAARGVIRTAFTAKHMVTQELPHQARRLSAKAAQGVSGAKQAMAAPLRAKFQLAGNIWYRGRYVGRYYAARVRPALPWLFRSRETSNFTYDLTERNRAHLASMLAVVLKRPIAEISGYIDELAQDEALKRRVIDRVTVLGRGVGLDPRVGFGRREGWYALVRALKPRVVIETGVEKGLGATVLCAALLRNKEEGHPGRYYGTDIDPGAGILWDEHYRSMGMILYGDSIASLETLEEEVDLFINDSDHSAEYEAREYRVILPKLSQDGVILADNAHVTDELYNFARENGREFLFFREEPADHWYLGAGIGLSFRQTGGES